MLLFYWDHRDSSQVYPEELTGLEFQFSASRRVLRPISNSNGVVCSCTCKIVIIKEVLNINELIKLIKSYS